MAISNVSRVAKAGSAPGDPVYHDIVTMDLDNVYPSGGYPAFEASVKGQIGEGRTILAVRANNSPGTPKVFPFYDRDNDKLLMHDWAGAEFSGSSDLSGVVGLELDIMSK